MNIKTLLEKELKKVNGCIRTCYEDKDRCFEDITDLDYEILRLKAYKLEIEEKLK